MTPSGSQRTAPAQLREEHFTRGYGDAQKPDAEIGLRPGANEEAIAFLADRQASLERLEHVALLIDGFETPYGMDLLSSVHWVATQEPEVRDAQRAIGAIHGWSDRKQKIFKPRHIEVGWNRLAEAGWVSATATR